MEYRTIMAQAYRRCRARTSFAGFYPSAKQEMKTWAESLKRQEQAKQVPQSATIPTTAMTFTDNWAHELIGGRASASATPQHGLLGRTPDQKAADVGEQPVSLQTPPSADAPKNFSPHTGIREKVLNFRANMAGKMATGPIAETVGLNGTNEPSDVMKVQSRLVEKGVLDSRYMSGYIGQATVDAIKALQKAEGLMVDGIIRPSDAAEAALTRGDPQGQLESLPNENLMPSYVGGKLTYPSIPKIPHQPKTFVEQLNEIYRGVAPPELRQQLEGIVDLGKFSLETLSPGADIKDVLTYSGQATDSFLDGDFLGSLGNLSLTGASLFGLGFPGSVGGMVKHAPASLPAFPDLKTTKKKTFVRGGGYKRERYTDKKGNIYEWDSQHGTLEKYDKQGKHLGEFDPVTGKQTKPAVLGRRTEK